MLQFNALQEAAAIANSFCLQHRRAVAKAHCRTEQLKPGHYEVILARTRRGQHVLDEHEDGFLWRHLYPFPDNVHKLTHSKVRRHQISAPRSR